MTGRSSERNIKGDVVTLTRCGCMCVCVCVCACVCVCVCVCVWGGVKDQEKIGISVRKEKVKRVRGVCRHRASCGARGAVERSRYARGTVLVRSRYMYARGALPVRYGSLTFQRAILYIVC